MTVFRLKQLASTSVHAAAGMIGWHYDRAELIADGVVHVLGVVFGLIAATVLIVLAAGLCPRHRHRRRLDLCRGPAVDAGAVGNL